MVRDTIQLEDAVSTISQEYLLEFTIPKSLYPELPGPEEPIVEFSEGKVGVYSKFFEFENFCIPISQFLFDVLGHYQIHLSQLSVIGAAKPIDSLKNWNNRFFWIDERIFPTVMEWRTNAPKDGMPPVRSYSPTDVTTLNTRRTLIQKQPEALLCLVGLSRSYVLGDNVYPTFLYDDDREMDLFNLISAPNPTKVKTGTRPCAAHEVSLLTATTSRVIDMEDTAIESRSFRTPPALEKSPLDFADEDSPQRITKRGGIEDQVQDGASHEIPPAENVTTTEVIREPGLEKEVAALGPPVNKRRRKRGNNEAEANASPKVLRKDHSAFRPAQNTFGGKYLASMGVRCGFHLCHPYYTGRSYCYEERERSRSAFLRETATSPRARHCPVSDPVLISSRKTATEIPTGGVAVAEVQGLFTAESPESGKSTSLPSMDGSPGGIYQPGWGVTNNCRLDTPEACHDIVDYIVPPRAMEAEVHGLHNRTKNLETLLEAEVDMKKAAEAKNAELAKELESLRVQFLDL
ncbi:hypothetical protein Tco_0912266 [Tanacetum coccineum]